MSSTLGRLSNIVIALVAAAPDRAIAGVTVAVMRTPATALRPTRPNEAAEHTASRPFRYQA